MNKLVLFVVIGLLVAGALGHVMMSSNSTPDVDENRIKIVTSFPMRGVTIGQEIVNGITLALEESDYKAGDFTVELVVRDGGDETGAWDGDLEEELAKEAVADEDVMIYLGTYNSGAAMRSIPITNEAGLVQISPGNTWPGLTLPGFAPGEPGIFYPTGIRSYFRVCPNDGVQGPAGAIWAEEMGVKRVYIYDDGESYGKGIADIFEKKALEIGLTVVGHETIDKKATDLTSKLEEIQDLDIDLIYFGGVTANAAVPLITGVRELGLDVKFMGPDGIMDRAFIEQSGPASEGVYVTVVGVPPSELEGDFFDNYVTRFGVEPQTFSSFGYEAAKVSLLAIERADVKDREAILEEVSNIKDYDSIFGTWSFDRNGDTTLTTVSGNTVSNGEFSFAKVLHEV